MYKFKSMQFGEQDGESVLVINYYSDEANNNIRIAFKADAATYCSDLIKLMQSADLEIKRANRGFSNES